VLALENAQGKNEINGLFFTVLTCGDIDMTRKVWKCAPLLAAIVASGLASQVHAVPQAYALSYDNLFNGLVIFSPPVLPLTPVPASGSAATLNGSGPSLTDPINAPPAVCPGGVGCGPGGSIPGPVVDNAFNAFRQVPSIGFNYGWGDSHVVSQQTINPGPPPTITPFHAVNEGESSVTAGNRASGDGNVGSGTFFVLNFTLGTVATIDLSLNAVPYLQVFLDAGSLGAPDQAAATLSASATIVNTDTGATVFNFAPDGTLFAFGGTVLSDPFSLNLSRVSSAPGGIGNSIYNPCLLATPPTGEGTPACGVANLFHAVTNPLPNGNYQLRLAAQELTNVNRSIPEPASIALLGLGLAALGLTRRRDGGSVTPKVRPQ
jgi:hypothetical protein